MLLGYNTNGLANHDGVQAIELLADVGYRSIGLTVDHQLLSPWRSDLKAQRSSVRQLLSDRGLRSVIETGARYLLDSRTKHHPTLLSLNELDRRRRMDFLIYCIELAQELQSDCVSLWSGVKPPQCDEQRALDLLAEGLGKLLEVAGRCGVRLAFEPEPGMFIDTMASFSRLLNWLEGNQLRLTMDIGHLFCQGEVPLADHIYRWRDYIENVHIEDMKAGVHDHLMFGEGDIHFPPVIRSLKEIHFAGGVHVELSRHSHDGPEAARRAFQFLEPLIRDGAIH
jgi:sugar phosphate isomerase/epimerase